MTAKIDIGRRIAAISRSAPATGEETMSVPKFDIFRGALGSPDVLWIEAVEGLGAAKQRMDEIARVEPGRYFVFYTHTHAILASTNTTELSSAINRNLRIG